MGEDTCDDGIDADGDGYADDPCDPCEEARQVAEDVGGEIHGPCDECSDNEDNVDLRFGRYLADALDVRLSSPGRVALEVVRFHRSPVRTIRNENTFGLGWVSNFAERLSGSLSGSPPSNVYWYVPGSRGAMHETCSAAGGGTYACAPMVGAHHTLKRLADNTWELVDLDGILTRFDSVGRLIGKYDRNASGFGYSVSWNGQGHLVSATDSTGRTILFVLDPENLGPGRLQVVDRVELQRSPSNIVLASYTYDRGLLVGVSAGGRGRTYEYDEGANGTHAHIARIAEESGNVTLAENTYDSESRVVETHSTFGSHAFRYDVTCWAGGPPGTLVMDLTAPELDGTGQPETCATDAQCSSGAACNSGTCYWTSCVDRDESHADKLKSITGNCGCGTSEFNWSSDLRATWVTDRNGVRTTYEYDSNGLVIAKCENDSDATVTRATPSTCPSTGRWTGIWYSSTFPGNPVEVRRKSVLSASNNSQTLLSYDANGRLDTVTEAGYTRGGSDTVVTYSYVTNHDYDTLGRLTKVDGPLSGTSDRVEYTYYPSGNGDNSYQLQRVRQYTSATAYLDTTYAAYDPYGRATQVTAANGTTTTYTFAADGRVLTTAVGGLTTSYAFDEGGRLEKATLPRGNVLLYRYDGQGRLQQLARRDVATNTDEDRLEITYDAAGRPLTRQALRQGESAWMMVKQAYDINGRLWRVYDPTDPTSQTYSEIGYDSVGRPTTDRDELGHLVESFFDSFGRLTQVRRHLDGTGSNYLSTGYAYSATFSPAPTTVTDGEGHATTYERDDLGRLTKVISPDAGTIRYVYDAAGQVVDRYAADGLRSHYVYDSAGRLTWADHDYGSASAFTSDVKYTYDTSTGCPTDISQGAAGRVARIDEQLFADTSLGDGVYDRVVCRYYDGLGRLVRETTLGDEGVTRHTEYEYDGNSNLVRLRYPMLTNAWARWDYDAAPSDNTDADDAYRVAAETTKGVTYIWAAKASERYAFGPLRRIWYGNSTATPPANPSREVLRRVDGSVSTLRDRLGGSGSWDILDRTYTYGPTAQISSFQDSLAGNPDRYYGYDWAHRLTCATKVSEASCPSQTDPDLLANVAYDDADNRATFKEYSGRNDTYVYTTGTDRLDRINHASQITEYTLDGSGRRTVDDNTSLSNDFRNYYYRADGRLRLVTGKRPSTNPNYQDYQTALAYDHKGRRIFKSDKNVSTGVVHQWWFYYDQSDRLIGVRDIPNAASPTTYNIHVMYYLDDQRVARMVLKYVNGSFSQEQRDLFHEDHLQTPMALERWPASGASTIVWSAEYKPWGHATVAGGSTTVVDQRFPGQWYDGETESRTWVSGVNTLARPGLAQNWMREYDAWAGYLSPEPLLSEPGFVGWTQAFSYAANDPVLSSDASGLGPCVLKITFDEVVPMALLPDEQSHCTQCIAAQQRTDLLEKVCPSTYWVGVRLMTYFPEGSSIAANCETANCFYEKTICAMSPREPLLPWRLPGRWLIP